MFRINTGLSIHLTLQLDLVAPLPSTGVLEKGTLSRLALLPTAVPLEALCAGRPVSRAAISDEFRDLLNDF